MILLLASLESGADSPGLKYSHFQGGAFSVSLVEDVRAFAKAVYNSRDVSDLFESLGAAVALTGLGDKAHPVA